MSVYLPMLCASPGFSEDDIDILRYHLLIVKCLREKRRGAPGKWREEGRAACSSLCEAGAYQPMITLT
jgi:hypothetical protein